MRILSRLLANLSRSNEARTTLLGGCLAVGVVLSAGVASAQPAPAAGEKPPVPKPAKAPTKADPPAAAQPAAAPEKPAAPPAAAPAPAAVPAAPAPAAAAHDEPLIPPPAAAAPVPATPRPAATTSPDVDRDEKALARQGGERPSSSGSSSGEVAARASDVFAEDWWTQARPVFEIHGYYRVRAELFHNFALGRGDYPALAVPWPQPADNTFTRTSASGTSASGTNGTNASVRSVAFCGADLTKATGCQNNTQAGANMRFRLNPEIHVSDNLRVMAQVDMLDNLVLGSTPEGYSNTPTGSGYSAAARGGYTPLGAFSTTQWAPVAGVNSTQNSVTVKRVWGEFMTPVGLLRFGRMPDHWGLGMMYNGGDGHDSDWQTNVDRIQFVTGIKKYDLYVAGMWDFANEGPSSASFAQQQGQPYDLAQMDDVNQFGVMVFHRRDAELQRLDLAKGDVVINGGAYFQFRNQVLAADPSGNGANSAIGMTADKTYSSASDKYSVALTRRGYQAYIPDLWLQILYRKFRFEAEGSMIYGSIDNTLPGAGGNQTPNAAGVSNAAAAGSNYLNTAARNTAGANGWSIRQFGVATQSEFRAIEDRLRIQFGFGWASGDPDYASLTPAQTGTGNPNQTYNRTFSQFAFHPDYRIDLILFRNILQRVTGAYYFRPSVEYDFARNKDGQRLGGGAAVIWSRASEFIQTPGHAPDLGIELNGKLYFQSRDGTLNDNPNKMGGFFTSLEYGVLFPLGGLGYLPGQQPSTGTSTVGATPLGTATAQTLRWYMGVHF